MLNQPKDQLQSNLNNFVAGRKHTSQELPQIPDKLYFTIGEASELSLVKPHVLRYWEKEFSSLNPSKRRGGRRYYERKDLILVRKIRSLLYDQGFTIDGARKLLADQNHESKNTSNNELIKNLIIELKKVLVLLESN